MNHELIPEWLREAQRQRRYQRCECVYPATIDTGIGYRCIECGGWLTTPPKRIQPNTQPTLPPPRRPKQHPRYNAIYLDPQPAPKPLTIIAEWIGYFIATILLVWLFLVWSSL